MNPDATAAIHMAQRWKKLSRETLIALSMATGGCAEGESFDSGAAACSTAATSAGLGSEDDFAAKVSFEATVSGFADDTTGASGFVSTAEFAPETEAVGIAESESV